MTAFENAYPFDWFRTRRPLTVRPTCRPHGETVIFGMHGGTARHYNVPEGAPEYSSTLDYLVASVGGCLIGTLAWLSATRQGPHRKDRADGGRDGEHRVRRRRGAAPEAHHARLRPHASGQAPRACTGDPRRARVALPQRPERRRRDRDRDEPTTDRSRFGVSCSTSAAVDRGGPGGMAEGEGFRTLRGA